MDREDLFGADDSVCSFESLKYYVRMLVDEPDNKTCILFLEDVIRRGGEKLSQRTSREWVEEKKNVMDEMVEQYKAKLDLMTAMGMPKESIDSVKEFLTITYVTAQMLGVAFEFFQQNEKKELAENEKRCHIKVLKKDDSAKRERKRTAINNRAEDSVKEWNREDAQRNKKNKKEGK